MNDATQTLTKGQSATESAIAEILKRNAPVNDFAQAEARLAEVMKPARLSPV